METQSPNISADSPKRLFVALLPLLNNTIYADSLPYLVSFNSVVYVVMLMKHLYTPTMVNKILCIQQLNCLQKYAKVSIFATLLGRKLN